MGKKGFMDPVERANAKIKELEGEQGTAPATPPVEPPPVEPPAIPAEPPVEPQGSEPPPPPAGDDENSQTYKARWEALKGILNGERKKVEGLTSQVEELQQQVQILLSRQPAEPAPGTVLPGNATAAELQNHLEELQEEYGDRFTTVLQGFVRGEVKSILEQELDPIRKRFDTVQKTSEELQVERLEAALESKAPGWKAAVQTQEFVDYLDSNAEPISGLSYRQLFDDANGKRDIERLSVIINNFKNSQGQAPPPEPPPSVDPREKLVAPGKSGGSAPPAGNQPKIWTRAEVDQFYKDCQRGVYRGREAEANAIDADILRANVEGRIR